MGHFIAKLQSNYVPLISLFQIIQNIKFIDRYLPNEL